jgi:alkanesulfonate monooxygenase SsuD/methylene tetrahydromethanopterin reductase-like flavin-dependent oxidoreductase (luciferase family)
VSDDILAFLERCFASDEVEANGQPFLFRPRPPRPPLLVGGAAPHALRRAVRFGGGWMPMGNDPEKLRSDIEQLRTETARAGRPTPEVALITGLDLDDVERGVAQVEAFAAIGVTRIVQGFRYQEPAPFLAAASKLARIGARLRSR